MSKNKDFILGKQLYSKKLFEPAVVSFTKAIQQEENPYIYYERGISNMHISRFPEALSDFDTAAELQPENSFRFSSRAFLKERMGDLEGARTDYGKCIELDPNDAIAYNNLGILEEKMGRLVVSKKYSAKADLLLSENSTRYTTEDLNSPNVEEDVASSAITEYLKLMGSVFTKKAHFSDFLKFIKRGFKNES